MKVALLIAAVILALIVLFKFCGSNGDDDPGITITLIPATGVQNNVEVGEDPWVKHFSSPIPTAPSGSEPRPDVSGREPTATPSPTLEPTPEPTPTVVPEPEDSFLDLAPLEAILEQELAEYPNWWVSTCVTDLQTGQVICIDGDTQRDTACTINLFALFVAVEEFEAGTITPDYVVESFNGIPVDMRISTLVRAGVGSSSPNHVAMFLSAVKDDSLVEGTHRAREIVAELGLENTSFGYVPYNKIEADYPPNLITARDMNKALSTLWNGNMFSPEWTSYTIDVLTNSEYTDTMPNLVQWKGAKVAHKIGYFGYESGYNFSVWNDSGIVYWEKDGREIAFALSFYSQGPWAGKDIVAGMADLSFDYFDAAY